MKRSALRKRAPRRAGATLGERAELDRLARWVVMLRANAFLVTDEGREQWWGNCQRCVMPNWLSWSHIFTRAAWCTRWDSDNAFAWCRGCHRWMDQHWEDKREWVIERIGETGFDALKLRSKGSRPDLAAWRLLLRRELRLMGALAAAEP